MNVNSPDHSEEGSGAGLEQTADRRAQENGARNKKVQSGSENQLRYLVVTTLVLALAIVGLAVWGAGQIGAAQTDAQSERTTAQGAQATAQAVRADASADQ